MWVVRISKSQLMIHDRYVNVLFLHRRVPTDVEATLESNIVLERYDGSVRIGLILLTEETVGPSFARMSSTYATHYGINFRTYVRELAQTNPIETSGKLAVRDASDHHPNTRWIHISSLECDDEFTSDWGANSFGIPSRIAEMKRNYGTYDKCNNEHAAPSNHSNFDYRIQSKHLPSSIPSFVRTIYHALNWRPRVLHSTANDWKPPSRSEIDSSISAPPTPSQQFTVDCSWIRHSSHDKDTIRETEPSHEDFGKDSTNIEPFDQWATEYYFVNTHRYGRNWRELVEHEPWPADNYRTTRVEHLSISGVESHESEEIRPILWHMTNHKPSLGFSPGVCPVTTIIQPV